MKGFAGRLKAASATFKSKQAHPRDGSIAAITDGGLFSAFYQLRSTFPFTSPSHESSLMSSCWISNFLPRASIFDSVKKKSVLKTQRKLLICWTKIQEVEFLFPLWNKFGSDAIKTPKKGTGRSIFGYQKQYTAVSNLTSPQSILDVRDLNQSCTLMDKRVLPLHKSTLGDLSLLLL